MSDTIQAILTIVVIDLVLSGDNAVVIGMAARRLSPENRRKAILWGGGGAIALRIIFTVLAALLLEIPYLQLIGGILLLWIAFKLLKPSHGDESVSEADSLGQAIRTIVLADVVMSLDNILAVGGAADGHLGLLVFGLLLSIPILLLGSELVARVIGRFPIILYVGVLVLVHTATHMILDDPLVHERLPKSIDTGGWQLWAFATGVTAILALIAYAIGRRPTAQVTADFPTPGGDTI